MKKILVIKSHTRKDSLCNALTDKYIKGAKEKGHDVKVLSLISLNLEQFIKYEHKENPKLPKDLLEAQKLITWADHLVFTYPTWWATPPALLKVFIEIIFAPGFAFQYQKMDGFFPKWDKLLSGKTARILVTMDSPPFYMNWMEGDPGGKMMKYIMRFTGIKFIGKHYFGSVKTSINEKRIKWLNKAYNIGLDE